MGRPRMPISTHGTVNLREVEPGVWRARTLYRFPDGTRRQVERFRAGRTGAKAANALMEALVDIASPNDGDLKPSTPLSAAAEQFVVAKGDAGLAAGSLAEYERVVRRVIVPRLGDLRLAEATPGRLQAFFTAVTKDHGPGTAKTTRSVLSGILGMAVRADALRTNPVAQVAAIRRGSSRASTALQLDTVPIFIRTVVDDPELKRADVGDLLAFMVMSGCRIGEALALTWERVDLVAAKVTFDATVVRVPGKGLLHQQHGKTAASTRTISIPAQAVELLERRDRIAAVAFPSLMGTLRDPVDAESVWRRNRDRLGYPSSTSHSLRKTTATALDVAGMSARAIAEYLGHSKPSLTQDVYMSRNVGSAAAADHLDRMFGVSSGLASGPKP